MIRPAVTISPRLLVLALAAVIYLAHAGGVGAQQGPATPPGAYGVSGTGNYPGAPLQYPGPVAPVQSQRPGGWPGGPGQPDPPPTRKQFSPAFGSVPAVNGPSGASPPPANLSALPASMPNAAGGRPPMAGAPGVVPAPAWTNNPDAAAQARPPQWVANNTAGPAPPAVEVQKAALPPRFEGAEILARVGSEVILAGDVLYEVNRRLEGALKAQAAKEFSAEQIEQGKLMLIQQALKRTIETKLLFVEARRKIPPEQMPKVENHFNQSFEKQYLKKFIELEHVRSRTELEAKLRRAGTTFDAVRRQQFEASFASHWLEEHVKDDDEITLDEMRMYYRDHAAKYEKIPRARWEQIVARFDKFGSKSEAYQAIAAWGNEVVGGASFADVAKAHSHDFSAEDGGVHPWTSKGSLASAALDREIFSLPVDKLSQVLEDSNGFHIVRVIERDDETRVSFADAQAEIKRIIREGRTEDRRKEYLEKLREQTPIWTIFDAADGESKYSAGNLNGG